MTCKLICRFRVRVTFQWKDFGVLTLHCITLSDTVLHNLREQIAEYIL